MKKIALALAAISAMTVAAHAQTVVADADNNGVFSMEEIVAAFPEVTEEVFAAADANADGALDAAELAAAQEAGSIAK